MAVNKTLMIIIDNVPSNFFNGQILTTFKETKEAIEDGATDICTTQIHFFNSHVLFDLGYELRVVSHNAEVITKITPDGTAITNRFGKVIVCGRRIHQGLNLEKLLLANDFETF